MNHGMDTSGSERYEQLMQACITRLTTKFAALDMTAFENNEQELNALLEQMTGLRVEHGVSVHPLEQLLADPPAAELALFSDEQLWIAYLLADWRFWRYVNRSLEPNAQYQADEFTRWKERLEALQKVVAGRLGEPALRLELNALRVQAGVERERLTDAVGAKLRLLLRMIDNGDTLLSHETEFERIIDIEKLIRTLPVEEAETLHKLLGVKAEEYRKNYRVAHQETRGSAPNARPDASLRQKAAAAKQAVTLCDNAIRQLAEALPGGVELQRSTRVRRSGQTEEQPAPVDSVWDWNWGRESKPEPAREPKSEPELSIFNRLIAPNVAPVRDETDALFDGIVGLDNVKQLVRSLQAQTRIQLERKRMGLPVVGTQMPHMVFKGNPGTGKTMIARLIGKILHRSGVLKSDKFIETDRSGLVAAYVGQTAMMTRGKVVEALDGILFIDEAYALANDAGSANGYGQESVDTLVKCLDDYRDRVVVILAGYGDEMDAFLEQNAGLASRSPNVIEFPDYSTDELMTMATRMFAEHKYRLTEEAADLLLGILAAARLRPGFGNGRYVRNLYEKTLRNQSLRLQYETSLTKDKLVTIKSDDIERV